jgi:hypothetical protein
MGGDLSPHQECSSQGFPHGICLNQYLSQIDNKAYVCNRDLAALYPSRKPQRMFKTIAQTDGPIAKWA